MSINGDIELADFPPAAREHEPFGNLSRGAVRIVTTTSRSSSITLVDAAIPPPPRVYIPGWRTARSASTGIPHPAAVSVNMGDDDDTIVGDSEPPEVVRYDWIGSWFSQLSDYVSEPKTMFIVVVVLLLTMAFMTVAFGKLRSKSM
jgi:hypothetical protein